MKKLTLAVYTALITTAAPLVHADSQLATKNPHYGEKGWDVEIVGGVGHTTDFLYKQEDSDETDFAFISVNGSYYGENFYFVADDDEGLLVGYNMNKTQDSAWDVILAPRFAGFDTDDEVLKDLDERKVDLHAGVRYTQYMGDSLYEFEYSKDISGRHGGSILSANYQKEWQKKNWVFTGSATAAYISETMTDYYFGVSADEATAEFAEHQSDAAVFVAFGLKAEYPINEHWVAVGKVDHVFSDGKVADSPITLDEDQISSVSASIKYHF